MDSLQGAKFVVGKEGGIDIINGEEHIVPLIPGIWRAECIIAQRDEKRKMQIVFLRPEEMPSERAYMVAMGDGLARTLEASGKVSIGIRNHYLEMDLKAEDQIFVHTSGSDRMDMIGVIHLLPLKMDPKDLEGQLVNFRIVEGDSVSILGYGTSQYHQ